MDISVFMDDVAAVGTADNITKGIQNCKRSGDWKENNMWIIGN